MSLSQLFLVGTHHHRQGIEAVTQIEDGHISLAGGKCKRTIQLQGLNISQQTSLCCALLHEQVEFGRTFQPLILTLADLKNTVGLFAGGRPQHAK